MGPFASFARVQAESDALIFELIEERRNEDSERDDILSMLLAARHDDGSPMSDQELRDELLTLLVAGHETTASSLAWAFVALPRHPGVLRRLTGEIESGGDDAYLVATIHEVLRRRPVLPNVGPRLTMEPIEIGTAVAGNIGTEHRFEYTVIGDPVNEAARLSDLAKQRPGRVLASEAALDRARDSETGAWDIMESAVLRGRGIPTGVAGPA